MDDDFANMAHLDTMRKAAISHGQWYTDLTRTLTLKMKEMAEAKHNSVEIQAARFMDHLQRRFRFLLKPIPTTKTLTEMWQSCEIHAWRQVNGEHHVQFIVTEGVITRLRFAFPATAICATYTEDVLSLLFAFLDQKQYLTYCTDIPSTPITLDLTFSSPRSTFVQL